MMPEEDPVLGGDLLDPLDHQFDEVGEMAIESRKRKVRWKRPITLGDNGEQDLLSLPGGGSTYLFPVGTCLGLMSFDLKAAKNSSAGHAE